MWYYLLIQFKKNIWKAKSCTHREREISQLLVMAATSGPGWIQARSQEFRPGLLYEWQNLGAALSCLPECFSRDLDQEQCSWGFNWCCDMGHCYHHRGLACCVTFLVPLLPLLHLCVCVIFVRGVELPSIALFPQSLQCSGVQEPGSGHTGFPCVWQESNYWNYHNCFPEHLQEAGLSM